LNFDALDLCIGLSPQLFGNAFGVGAGLFGNPLRFRLGVFARFVVGLAGFREPSGGRCGASTMVAAYQLPP